jgi:phosphatidate phosphatase APP1
MLKKKLLAFLYLIKLSFSKFKLMIFLQTGYIKRLMIVPYTGFGNAQYCYFLGRVIKDRGIRVSALEDSGWKNISQMVKRFMTVVIPGVKVKAHILGMDYEAITDDEGYFEFKIQWNVDAPRQSHWEKVEFELLDGILKNQAPVLAQGEVFISREKEEFGVISDIDDTIVSTGATRLWDMLKTTFLQNAFSRIPFPGVSAFYKALEKGTDGLESNPMFYVSSSPWNLYDFLMEFLEVHQIPKGPLMLRDLGLSREQFIAGSHDAHKLKQIEHILSVYQDLNFILIGDSGQYDPEIYLQVVRDFPNRVKAIYIRDLQKARKNELRSIVEELSTLGVEMLLVKDTLEAAKHTLKNEWILAEEIQDIQISKSTDENLNEQ